MSVYYASQETAVCIGTAASLITKDMQLLTLQADSPEHVSLALEKALAAVSVSAPLPPSPDPRHHLVPALSVNNEVHRLSPPTEETVLNLSIYPAYSGPAVVDEFGLLQRRRHGWRKGRKFVLVVDGNTLAHTLAGDLHRTPFMRLADCCSAVICCRSSPAQKALVVNAVKKTNPSLITLAIGDGANDVAMIQTAHIGIGITGREGRQAAMSSDFVISKFRFLAPLLLVHGHWCYSRLAYMVLYFFYKNAAFVLLLFWYQVYCGFSAQNAINDVFLIFFTLVFTSLPVIVVGVVDQDVDRSLLIATPMLFQTGSAPETKLHAFGLFWLWLLDALWQSLVLFFVPYLATLGTVDMYTLGAIMCTSAVRLDFCSCSYYVCICI